MPPHTPFSFQTLFILLILCLCSCLVSAKLHQQLYNTLGVSTTASSKEIKTAFHKLAVKHHPDKTRDSSNPEANEKFQEIRKAYEVLSDTDKRKKYDKYGLVDDSNPPPAPAHFARESFFNRRAMPFFSDAFRITNQNFNHMVTESNDLWIIFVFDPFDRTSKAFFPVFNEFTEQMQGIVRTGIVNANEDHFTARQLHVHYLPTLVAVHAVSTNELGFAGLRYLPTVDRVITFADETLPSHITHLTSTSKVNAFRATSPTSSSASSSATTSLAHVTVILPRSQQAVQANKHVVFWKQIAIKYSHTAKLGIVHGLRTAEHSTICDQFEANPNEITIVIASGTSAIPMPITVKLDTASTTSHIASEFSRALRLAVLHITNDNFDDHCAGTGGSGHVTSTLLCVLVLTADANSDAWWTASAIVKGREAIGKEASVRVGLVNVYEFPTFLKMFDSPHIPASVSLPHILVLNRKAHSGKVYSPRDVMSDASGWLKSLLDKSKELPGYSGLARPVPVPGTLFNFISFIYSSIALFFQNIFYIIMILGALFLFFPNAAIGFFQFIKSVISMVQSVNSASSSSSNTQSRTQQNNNQSNSNSSSSRTNSNASNNNNNSDESSQNARRQQQQQQAQGEPSRTHASASHQSKRATEGSEKSNAETSSQSQPKENKPIDPFASSRWRRITVADFVASFSGCSRITVVCVIDILSSSLATELLNALASEADEKIEIVWLPLQKIREAPVESQKHIRSLCYEGDTLGTDESGRIFAFRKGRFSAFEQTFKRKLDVNESRIREWISELAMGGIGAWKTLS